MARRVLGGPAVQGFSACACRLIRPCRVGIQQLMMLVTYHGASHRTRGEGRRSWPHPDSRTMPPDRDRRREHPCSADARGVSHDCCWIGRQPLLGSVANRHVCLPRRRQTSRRPMTNERRTAINTTYALKRIIAGALLAGSVAAAGFGVAAGLRPGGDGRSGSGDRPGFRCETC
jgi:hypothetical protein